MTHREIEENYEKALGLARCVTERHLAGHLQTGVGDRDESVEDLAQSIVGTESVVRLVMTVPFDEGLYEPVLIEAADEVGRAFFPDVHKRFVSSLEVLTDEAAAETPTEEAHFVPFDLVRAAELLPDGLKLYLGALANWAGVDYLTSRLWTQANPDEIVSRLTRLRRHFPDGDVRLSPDLALDDDLTPAQIVEVARHVAAGLMIAFPWGFFARQTQERSALATRYLVERELRRSPEELLEEGVLPFIAHGLGPALRRCGGSVNRLLALAFPERVKPWMESHVPPGFWDEKANRQEAVRWLVERRLGLSGDAIAQAVHEGKIAKRDFCEAGLTWLIKNVYRWSVGDALKEAYPALEPWEQMRRGALVALGRRKQARVRDESDPMGA